MDSSSKIVGNVEKENSTQENDIEINVTPKDNESTAETDRESNATNDSKSSNDVIAEGEDDTDNIIFSNEINKDGSVHELRTTAPKVEHPVPTAAVIENPPINMEATQAKLSALDTDAVIHTTQKEANIDEKNDTDVRSVKIDDEKISEGTKEMVSDDGTESLTEEDHNEDLINNAKLIADLQEKESEIPIHPELSAKSHTEDADLIADPNDELIPIKSELLKEVEDVILTDQKNFNNQIQDIISDIDINIRAQEKITLLKEQELKLIKKQNELADQIQQQEILAQQLEKQNLFKQQQLEQTADLQLRSQQNHDQTILNPTLSISNINYNESINAKTVDLRKIFTPAADSTEILPKNRKLYASSAFYSSTLHPTVEDQVELARRISHSLSDISNQTSKGQSMYVNRKKRSVKWVHEGSAQENSDSSSTSELTQLEKTPLKLIMNPRGQVSDYNSLKELINVETGLLSPDNCAELITALQLHQGRGAELFAKRRRKADNWVVDETNAGTQCDPSGIPDYQQYQPKPAISPKILPAYSDAGKHRVQLNMHQNQLIEKYSKAGLQVVKSPWEAALETGSASSAFLEKPKDQCGSPAFDSPTFYFQSEANDLAGAVKPLPYDPSIKNQQTSQKYDFSSASQKVYGSSNPQRELAYTPCVAQGWGGHNVELPKGLYVPKEISLTSYAPPPTQFTIQHQNFLSPGYETAAQPLPTHNLYADRSSTKACAPATKSLSLIPNQQHFSQCSYNKLPQEHTHNGSKVNFNPSPLAFDKLSRYEQSDKPTSPNKQYLSVRTNSLVRNASPTPFGLAFNEQGSKPRSTTTISPSQHNRPTTIPSRCEHLLPFPPSQKNQASYSRGSVQGKQIIYPYTLSSQSNLPYSEF